MNDNVVIVYNSEQVSVPKEVADFLEQDRKREQAQEKQDARHLSKSCVKICVNLRKFTFCEVFFASSENAVK